MNDLEISGYLAVCVLRGGWIMYHHPRRASTGRGEQRGSVFFVCAGGEALFLATFLLPV